MIPILYEKDEKQFTRNGLGRLHDCVSCIVTEERNGIYECNFSYPVTGAHYDEILIGRIIGVEHDDTNDIQPFDIVSYSRPIDGVVEFHAVHISYRQSGIVAFGRNINSLSDAFAMLKKGKPSNPFTYSTNIVSDGYMAAANGVPQSVRALLGGVEGSILDTYGGEFEWDKFRVILHSERGQKRDFKIRYGLNMVDYTEDLDISETYKSCIPYWTDGNKVIRGSMQTLSKDLLSGRNVCAPLDVSDKFEKKPTQAQVEAMGLSMLKKQKPYKPVQTINIEFVRLQDVGYEEYANLLRCNLCDTITVIMQKYNVTADFKIVKTVWDVLADRYESMELGDLSTTLSEALGISEFGNKDSGYEEINGVDKITVANGSSGIVDLANSERAFIIGVGGGTTTSAVKMLALANCTSSGAVTNLKIDGTGTSVTLTNGTNKLTISNTSSYSMDVLIIRF